MLGLLIRVAAIALIGYIVWSMMRPRYHVRIVMDEHGIKYHEGIPKGHQSQVLEFLDDEVAPSGKLTIYARHQPDGYLRVDFRGHIDTATQQRIRNVLINAMF